MDRRSINRFCEDGPSPIVLGKLRSKIAVLQFIETNVSHELSSLRSLQEKEFFLNTNYRGAWEAAKKEYLKRKKNPNTYPQVCVGGHPEEYHIALIAYTIHNSNLYSDFNTRTREIRTAEDFEKYPYKSFFMFLLLAVKNVAGEPTHLPPTQKLYRGVLGKVENAVVGNYAIFQHFVSTTQNLNVAESFAEQGKERVIFVIDGVRAGEMWIGMEDHSNHQIEKEVLIWPYECYIISKVEESGNRMEIHLKP